VTAELDEGNSPFGDKPAYETRRDAEVLSGL
jgi:hypothetical protein